MSSSRRPGFTLIELLVVIAIIGLLAVLALTQYGLWGIKARQAKVASDLRETSKAIETYRLDNGAYPVTYPNKFVGEAGSCSDFGRADANSTYVPGIVPRYLAELPLMPGAPVPSPNCSWGSRAGSSGDSRTYLYVASPEGKGYKLIAHQPENCYASEYTNIWDPLRRGRRGKNGVPGDYIKPKLEDGRYLLELEGIDYCWAWSIYSEGMERY